MRRQRQLNLLEKTKGQEGSSYGGSLLKTRRGRSSGRPLSTSSTMHLVLRSAQAKGSMSFLRHQKEIKNILTKFSKKYHVQIFSYANVGNHLHLHLKLAKRQLYNPFIRAISSAIMMKVTGFNRWTKESLSAKLKTKFWDQRPFTRILKSFKERLNLKDYIAINQIEALGYSKNQARFVYYWRLNST